MHYEYSILSIFFPVLLTSMLSPGMCTCACVRTCVCVPNFKCFGCSNRDSGWIIIMDVDVLYFENSSLLVGI